MKMKPLMMSGIVVTVVWSLLGSDISGQPVNDDFESGLSLWQATGQWGLSTGIVASPTHSITDSPGAFYPNNEDSFLTLSGPVDLSSIDRPALAFQHAYLLENGYDFGHVEVSINNGATWQAIPLASYTGTRADMVREQLDLAAFAGASQFKIRFRISTDDSVVMDGWYVDDVHIGSMPEPVTLETPVLGEIGQTSIMLHWSASIDPGFGSYVVLRGNEAGFDWHTAKTVATISDASVTQITDVAVAPKSGYHYKVMTLTEAGLHSLSNEISVTTLAGMDYPFLDDAEGGPHFWVADSPWAISEEDYHSLGHAWSDSPGGNYADGIASQSMVLAAPLDLTAATDPVLTFHHRYDFAAGDTANVELSTNMGASWVSLATYITGSADWSQVRIPLTNHVGQPSVLIRFRMTTSASANADGWYVDDISVAEAPAVVSAPAIREVTSHSMRLDWLADSSLPFSHYAIHRSTSPGVGLTSEQVATITDQTQTSYTDVGLALDTLYYYRIYAVSPYGTYSADSGNEASARTLNHPLPFIEGFEGDLLAWNTGSDAGVNAWGVFSDQKHSGSAALASSPGASYAHNTNSYIETSVDLSTADWPVLTFWDRYGLNTGDYIRLEISATGRPTVYAYGAYDSSRNEWLRQRVDLSPWKGVDNVKLRFRTVSDNAATPGEGWFIDDLDVAENPNRNTPLVLPFTDDFEGGGAGWLLSSWTMPADAEALDGAAVLRDGTSVRRMAPDTQQWAVLDRPVPLAAGSNVQVTWWVRGTMGRDSSFALQYSINGGVTWADSLSESGYYGYDTAGDWWRLQASLSGQAGQTLRLRMATRCDSRAPVVDISFDKFTLAEMPDAVALTSAVPALRSVELAWDETTLGTAFVRYEVWRSSSPNVSISNGQKVFETTDPATTTCIDSGLNIGAAYYYKVICVDDRGTYTPSNELAATTVPVAIPFSDPMESMANWVSGTDNATPSTWTTNTDNPHGGSASLATVPVGQYAHNTNSYIETSVDLSTADWPVLTFWDRYGLNTGDYIRLEISATGRPTVYAYGAYDSSRSEWLRQRVDLSQWKGMDNVKLRFRTVSDNAATPGEGWFIDDLDVAENPNRNTPLVLPFTDDFEGGGAGWLLSSWTMPADAEALDGAAVLRDGTSGRRMAPETQQWAVLDRPVPLAAGANVQVTWWVRGTMGRDSSFALQYSINNGVTWADSLSESGYYGYDTAGDWRRLQASLSGQAGQTLRLRMATRCDSRAPVVDISFDKFTLAEMPDAVAMSPIGDVDVTSMTIHWTASPLGTFQRYEVYRSTSSNVSNTSDLVAVLTEQSASSFTDTGLESRIQYFYRVYLVDSRGTYSPSGVVSATTLGIPLPMMDDFESAAPGWTFTGQWQLQDGVGKEGGTALSDSPGDCLASSDTHARFAINLSGTEWPVLRYWDKHQLAGNSWGRVEVSTNLSTWVVVNGVTETRSAWQHQEIDLSQWKTEPQVYVRFRLSTDANAAEGWTIDDLSVSDMVADSVYPFFDGFESGASNWLAGSWLVVDDAPYHGSAAVQDTVNRRNPPDTPNYLDLAHDLDLTSAVDPTLTFLVRGTLAKYSWFRARISTNGGASWTDLSSLNLDTEFNSTNWIKKQVSLAAWTGQKVRLRFASGGDSRQPASDIFLDNIGIGEASPTAPVAVSPFENETVEIVRPTLTVDNAVDHQSDALSYQFEVYSDAALSQIAAQVPSVSGGVFTTSWQVDVDLPDHAPYWWRARASDGLNTGPWSEAVVFNINEFNNAPLPVVIASPANDSLLVDGNGLLVWFQTSDPDLGDQVLDYQIQIDDDYMFGSPEIDYSGITVEASTYGPGYFASVSLGGLPGAASLPSGRWFWRIRARDTRFASGAWPDGFAYFLLPTIYQRYLRSLYSDPDWFLYDVTNPEADPDSNGVGVLWEFACAIVPGDAPGDRLPVSIDHEISELMHQGFEFTRRKNSELVFLLDVSSDMNNWAPDGRAAVEVLSGVDATSERVRIVDPDPVGSHYRRFIRLRVRDRLPNTDP